VSQAFLAVHRQAIRTAADLANTRAGLSQILLHLARRNQRLVGGLIRELDGAERGEDDPDRLATLFRLDQLATRMGRYNDNLLVVGGQSTSRVDAADVPLDTVIRGAQSKIEYYQRVNVAIVDAPLFVRGTAVNDLINLLAELLDNATHFSTPDSFVDVAAGVIDGRAVIRVRDVGVGMPLGRIESFNQTLASAPIIDVSAIRSMGLTVVAHIAARHGIAVRLLPGGPVGVLAEISLPREVCLVPGYPAPPAHRPRTPAVGASEQVRIRPPHSRDEARTARPARMRHSAPASHRGPTAAFSWFRSGGGRRTDRYAEDDGWVAAVRAAAHAANPQVGDITRSGLPRRPPMANLVPGSVPDGRAGVAAVDQRNPAVVAASVAAFAQGNAVSRQRHADARAEPSDSRIPPQRTIGAAQRPNPQGAHN
jgi:hypothetical protein